MEPTLIPVECQMQLLVILTHQKTKDSQYSLFKKKKKRNIGIEFNYFHYLLFYSTFLDQQALSLKGQWQLG